MKISVLDQSPVSEGSTGAVALRNTLDLAKLADKLGYTRYWVAEHHGTPLLACANPEVMIAAIASVTSRIRVGSGGVMLPHYSPLKVAETFSILSALFPERIDLGLGRAPGTDHHTAFALQRDRRQAAPNDFPEQLGELLGYLENNLPTGHPFARLADQPVFRTYRKCGCWVRPNRAQSGRLIADYPMLLQTSSIPMARTLRRFTGSASAHQKPSNSRISSSPDGLFAPSPTPRHSAWLPAPG